MDLKMFVYLVFYCGAMLAMLGTMLYLDYKKEENFKIKRIMCIQQLSENHTFAETRYLCNLGKTAP